MITEDYVSFETAKLLKEKGFENDAISCINVFKGHIYKIQDRVINADDDVTIPTITMAMKWLREVHNIFFEIKEYFKLNQYQVFVHKNGEIIYCEPDWFHPICDSYEQACEAAIKYCLENLI